MRKAFIALAAVGLLSSAAVAQSTDTKAPATTGPAAQSGDNMSKGDMTDAELYDLAGYLWSWNFCAL